MIVLQIIVFLLGLGIALSTLFSAIKQTVLPGRKKVRLTRAVFRNTFRLFRFVAVRMPSDQARDAIIAFYAPMSVMLLPLTWAILLMIGFTTMFWAVSEPSLGTALSLSGAAITTEGFLAPKGVAQTTLYIVAGIIGLGIVGLLITFLPTVYSIYSQREEEVTRVAFRFGSPPSGVKVLEQAYLLGLAQELDEFWRTWENWFETMAETHISNSEVIFYRSSQPGTSWITTAGAILDASALFASNDSNHVTHEEYDAVCEQLSSAGVPLKGDREESWHAFVSMRSQYDFALIALANFVHAPEAPWSSDRKLGLTARDLVRSDTGT